MFVIKGWYKYCIHLQRICHIPTNICNTGSPDSYLLPPLNILHENYPQVEYVEVVYSDVNGLINKREV